MLLEARFSILKDFIQFFTGNIPTLRVHRLNPLGSAVILETQAPFWHMHSAASINNSRFDYSTTCFKEAKPL
jgi:hypothetical protein